MHAQSDVMLPLLLLLRAGAAGAAAVIGMVQGQADCLHCMGAQHVLQRQHVCGRGQLTVSVTSGVAITGADKMRLDASVCTTTKPQQQRDKVSECCTTSLHTWPAVGGLQWCHVHSTDGFVHKPGSNMGP